MDPLENQIPHRSGNIPAKPDEPIPGFDLGAYAGGGAAFFATQLFSKTYPHLAVETSRNTLGIDLNASKSLKPSISPLQAVLALAPAPFGFAPPEEFGLAPNYLYSIESRLKSYNAGLEVFAPPNSSLLHTLPDYDPRVQYANAQERAKEQRQAVENLTRTAPIGELFDLYEHTFTPAGQQRFYKPDEIATTIRVGLIARTGGFQEYEATARQYLAAKQAEAELLATIQTPTGKPGSVHDGGDPLAALTLPQLTVVAQVFGLGGDLDEPSGGGPVDPTTTAPVNNDVREANGRARPPLSDNATDRADP